MGGFVMLVYGFATLVVRNWGQTDMQLPSKIPEPQTPCFPLYFNGC